MGDNYVDKYRNQFQGTLWELKPVSWMYDKNKYNYQKALNQINGYITQKSKGCWSAGSSKVIIGTVSPLNNMSIQALSKTYTINFNADPKSDSSGLFFYSFIEQKKASQEKELQNADLPATISPTNTNQMKKVKDGFAELAKHNGFNALEIIGIILLIAIAFILLRGAIQAIAALLLLLTSALSHAKGIDSNGQPIKKVPLIEALGIGLGIENLNRDYLLQKGKEYVAKQWDRVTKWAGDWFK